MQRLQDRNPTTETEEAGSQEIKRLAIEAANAGSRRERNQKIKEIRILVQQGFHVDRDKYYNPITKQLLDDGHYNAALILIEYFYASRIHLARWYGKHKKYEDFISLYKSNENIIENRFCVTQFGIGVAEGMKLNEENAKETIIDLAVELQLALPPTYNANDFYFGLCQSTLLLYKHQSLDKTRSDLAYYPSQVDQISLLIKANRTSDGLALLDTNIHLLDTEHMEYIINYLLYARQGDVVKKYLVSQDINIVLYLASAYGNHNVVEDIIKNLQGLHLQAAAGYAIGGYTEYFIEYFNKITTQEDFDYLFLFFYKNKISYYIGLVSEKVSIERMATMIREDAQYPISYEVYCSIPDVNLANKLFGLLLSTSEFKEAQDIRSRMEHYYFTYEEAVKDVQLEPQQRGRITRLLNQGSSLTVIEAEKANPELGKWVESAAAWCMRGELNKDVTDMVLGFVSGKLRYDDATVFRRRHWPKGNKYQFFTPPKENEVKPAYQPGEKRTRSATGSRKRNRM